MATVQIVPAVKPVNRELAGVNQATCEHQWVPGSVPGFAYWCKRCLLPGAEEVRTAETFGHPQRGLR